MKTWHWVLLIVVLVAVAFFVGRWLSTLKKTYDNRDKIAAGFQLADAATTLLG